MKFTGIDKIRFINLCKNLRLDIWNVSSKDNEIIFNTSISSFYKMKNINRKCNGKLRIINKKGLPFYISKNKKHLFFVIGIVIFFIISKIITLYIWNISFDGNYLYTDIELMNFLNKYNIENAIKKSKINCDEIEYLLRTNYDDITWVSAEIKGTQIIIHIKENFDTYIAKVEDKPYNIISNVDGTVESIITRSGIPKVKPSPNITKGQLLVSGIVEIYNDSNELCSYRLVNSDSDIIAKVYIDYNKEFDLDYNKKIYTNNHNNILEFDFFGKSIYLSGFQKKFHKYDIIKDHHQVSVTNNFYLPFAYNTIKINEYNYEKMKYTEEEAITKANDELNVYINKLSEKGIQIIENNVTIEIVNDMCVSKGNFLVLEKIGEISYISEKDIPIIAETETTT